MDADEREIFQFLKTRAGDYTAAMEVCRRAGSKQRFHKDPNWAKQVLLRMADRGILESDLQGRYRIKPVARKHKKQWVAPDIAKILQESGVQIEGEGVGVAEDDYYENL